MWRSSDISSTGFVMKTAHGSAVRDWKHTRSSRGIDYPRPGGGRDGRSLSGAGYTAGSYGRHQSSAKVGLRSGSEHGPEHLNEGAHAVIAHCNCGVGNGVSLGKHFESRE